MELRPALQWLAAADPVDNLVLLCADAAPLALGKRDAGLALPGHTQELTAAEAAQLLVQGASYLQLCPCPEQDPLARLQAVLGDLVRPYAPPERASRRPQIMDVATGLVPRRTLLPTRSDSALTLSASSSWRSFEAFHDLAAAHAIYRPKAFSEADALHCLRCSTCATLIEQCRANANRNVTARAAATDFSALCPACQVAVHYCPNRSAADEEGAATLASFTATQQDGEQLQPCEKCKNPHPAAEGELCRMCAYREQHPFTAAMPTEALAALPEDVRRQLRGI